ncbi:MAG: tyrosine-type recombinase/integrase [Pirellulales bacterium]
MHEIVSRYILSRDIKATSAEQLEYALASFGKFLKVEPTAAHFSDDNVNRYLLWLAGEGFAHDTIKSRRRALLTLWRSLVEDDRAAPPRKVRRLAPRTYIPRAWTPDQIAAILGECEALSGTFRRRPDIQRRDYAVAICRTFYESGFRRSDVLRIRRPQIQPSGLIVLVQSKTGVPHKARIRPQTIEAIDRMGTSGRETVFGGVVCTRWLSDFLKGVFQRAGIEEGSLKWFRRSGCTHVERERPDEGWKFLGHTTPRVAKQSYIDPTQLDTGAIMPPDPPHIDRRRPPGQD